MHFHTETFQRWWETGVLMRGCAVAAVIVLIPIMMWGELATADVIRLKSGRTIEGNIVHQDERQVMVELPGLGKMSVSWERIASIEASPRERFEAEWKALRERLEALTARLTALDEKLSLLTFLKHAKAQGPSEERDPFHLLANPTVVVVALLLGFVGYCYVALCFQLIARKTGTRRGWLAWVPVLQLLLPFWVAGRSIWWLAPLIFVRALSETLGTIATVLFGLVVCVGLAEARGKPFWVGLLLGIPGINLVVLGYLAFSQAPS